MVRVTSQSLSNQVIDSLQQAYQRVARAQEMVTSGRRINRLSDDPIGATRVLALRSVESSLTQYQSNITNSRPLLETTDTVLSGVTDALNRAKELALAMASDTTTQADRQATASEVEQIFLQVLALGNTTVENRALFGGYRNGGPAFAQGPDRVEYQGDNGQILIQTSTNRNLQINLLGNEVFQGTGIAGGVGVFDALQDLQQSLENRSSTNSLSLAVNLDSGLTVGSGFTPADAVGTEAAPATWTGAAGFSSSVTLFDSKGQAHALTFLFAKTGVSTFKYRVVANSSEITGGTPGDWYQVAPEGTLQFNADGSFDSAGSTLSDINLAGLRDGAADITISAANLSFIGSTHEAQPSAVLSQTQTNANGLQAQIGRLDAALDQISRFRAVVGARLGAAQASADAVALMKDHTTAQRSNLEDADVLSIYSDFARLQNAFQAALQSASQMIKPSLLDFLR